MKIIITESSYKNVLFRYWDKFGGDINRQFILNFGLDNNSNDITYDQAYKYLIEWRGEKESKELAKTLLLQNPHHINDFGGYDFFFEVTDIKKWGLNDDAPFAGQPGNHCAAATARGAGPIAGCRLRRRPARCGHRHLLPST